MMALYLLLFQGINFLVEVFQKHFMSSIIRLFQVLVAVLRRRGSNSSGSGHIGSFLQVEREREKKKKKRVQHSPLIDPPFPLEKKRSNSNSTIVQLEAAVVAESRNFSFFFFFQKLKIFIITNKCLYDFSSLFMASHFVILCHFP
jgi:hypothetical protein